MTSSPSPSTEYQCADVVTDAVNISKNKNICSEHMEDEEDEEGDVDFNPLLKEAPSLDASSSLSSEVEEFDADGVDSGENHTHIASMANAHDDSQENAVGNVEHGREMAMQASENTPLFNNNNEQNITTDLAGSDTIQDSRRHDDRDDEDAIWRRTRARYSLVGSTLDELETFLQETDDEDELHNIDDEEEYRKFLAAVLQDGDASSGTAQESENVDEDEDNDADFELEIEEALESDVDENLQTLFQEREHKQVCRRPETRQKKRQKIDLRHKAFSGQTNRPLRPILPFTPIAPFSAPNARSYMIQTSNDCVTAFTSQQVGQLHCLIYEHVQLLIQVFSLSILEPSRQHIASQVQRLLSEMLHNRDQVLACQRVPYPALCFNQPCTLSAEFPNNLQPQNSSEPMGGFFWMPYVSDSVESVLDVAPLNLVRKYVDDVSIVVKEHHQRKLEVTYDGNVDKECLFPFGSFHSPSETTLVPDRANGQKSRKTIAAELVERSKKQSIALVPKEIAKLARQFFPLFNPALFPHKPPPVSVANKALFTDSEDGLLARGLMKYNTDWKEIQKNYLPCKTAHQIFVRQKNRSCSRAPENPIKAVRRMKTSPLTPQEKALIEEGLKVFRLDWMAVWKYMVPHRDPSLLARQWRIAVGNKKSYKGDEQTKAKRRIYESKRRKSKLEGSKLQTSGLHNMEGQSTEEDANPLPGVLRCKTLSGKENCNTDKAGGENNSGDDGGNNEDEAYVHEAFLADWRPGPPSIFSEHVQERIGNDASLVNFHSHHFSISPHPVPAKSSTPFNPKVNMQPYRPRRSDHSRLVKLAPDLPPVNLPPTVRVMSQSAFTKFRYDASSKVRENTVEKGDAVEKVDADLQMHPLLFQDPEDGSLPYYPLNGIASSSSSLNFFSNDSPHLNLNLFRYPHQPNLNFNNSLKSTGFDFHPLLQRTNDGTEQSSCPPLIPEPLSDPSTSHRDSSLHNYIRSTDMHAIPPSPNELDLDIRLSSSARKENGGSARGSGMTEMQPVSSHIEDNGVPEETGNAPDLGGSSAGIGNDEIVMEQEELSDSEDEEMAESVEFECEEMTDTEGEGEGASDSDQVDDVQIEDVQDGCSGKDKVTVKGDETEPSQVTSLVSEEDEQRSLLGLSLNPSSAPRFSRSKLAVTRNPRSCEANRCLKNATLTWARVKKPRKQAQKRDDPR